MVAYFLANLVLKSSSCKGYLGHFSTQKIYSKKISYIFSKTFFLFFVKWNFLALRYKISFTLKPQPQKFYSKKISEFFFRKKPALKKFLIFCEMELSIPHLKNSYIFFKRIFFISRENLQSLENKNFLYFSKTSSTCIVG